MAYKLLENYSIDKLRGYEIDQIQEHLIVALSDSEVNDRDFQWIENFASDLINRSLSFVILSEKLTYEILPETVNLCPTLEEAIDLIEFEEIQRDLGL
ncbi:MAG: hypothetical protein ACO3NA_02155 [Flavobacteriaceae bacterium]|jgi:hypothetical protein|nr:hypothetical protein [Flavobacteriaceae bacterium]PTM07434.1 MAG: hypothetical protein DA439_01010 [Bacteroidota bacterium]